MLSEADQGASMIMTKIPFNVSPGDVQESRSFIMLAEARSY
jgi:hypothetical protein